jgi:hypothetical protein
MADVNVAVYVLAARRRLVGVKMAVPVAAE